MRGGINGDSHYGSFRPTEPSISAVSSASARRSRIFAIMSPSSIVSCRHAFRDGRYSRRCRNGAATSAVTISRARPSRCRSVPLPIQNSRTSFESRKRDAPLSRCGNIITVERRRSGGEVLGLHSVYQYGNICDSEGRGGWVGSDRIVAWSRGWRCLRSPARLCCRSATFTPPNPAAIRSQLRPKPGMPRLTVRHRRRKRTPSALRVISVPFARVSTSPARLFCRSWRSF
jgi:hypothetical protein